MKTLHLLEFLRRDDGDLIASFGDSRLVKHLNGKFELLGGSPGDRADAKEWGSRFLHEAAIAGVMKGRWHEHS
jgi:hypothetical protein